MTSREQKVTAGKILMFVSFLHIISLLPSAVTTLPSPSHIPIAMLLSVLGITESSFQLGISGITGFLLFGIGYELWERNREHWNEA